MHLRTPSFPGERLLEEMSLWAPIPHVLSGTLSLAPELNIYTWFLSPRKLLRPHLTTN